MDVAAGYEGRVDFMLSPLATVQVSGVVSGQPEGLPALVTLEPRTQIARMSLDLSAHASADGTFVIRHVPPSLYSIRATSGRVSAAAPVEVGPAGVDSLQLHLEPA